MNIALVAHDRRKADLIDWAEYNFEYLSMHHLYCTGTTGKLLKEAALKKGYDLDIECKLSGPLGGDADVASLLAHGNIDLLIFLQDDLSSQPHSFDIEMLSRQARIHNIFTACNRASADALLASPLLLDKSYKHLEPKYTDFDRAEFEKKSKN